jgi:hypothetical protein
MCASGYNLLCQAICLVPWIPPFLTYFYIIWMHGLIQVELCSCSSNPLLAMCLPNIVCLLEGLMSTKMVIYTAIHVKEPLKFTYIFRLIQCELCCPESPSFHVGSYKICSLCSRTLFLFCYPWWVNSYTLTCKLYQDSYSTSHYYNLRNTHPL